MAANRTIPTTGSGSAFAADLKDEIEALWKYSLVPMTSYGGTATAITANCAVTISALTDGLGVLLVPTADVTGALTLNVNGTGVKDVLDRHGKAIVKGMMKSGGSYPLIYNGTTGKFIAVTCERGLVGRQERYFSAATDIYARSSNGPAATTLETSTNKVNLKGLGFDSTAAEYAQFSFRAEKGWDEGTCTAIFVWCHTTGGPGHTVVWQIQGVAFSDGNAGDTAFGTAVTVTDSGGTANSIYITAETAAMTLSNTPAEGDFVAFQVFRDPTNASDTMTTIDAVLLGVHLFWTADSGEEIA